MRQQQYEIALDRIVGLIHATMVGVDPGPADDKKHTKLRNLIVAVDDIARAALEEPPTK